MGLTRKGDIYTLKAMCQSKKKSTNGDHEREARKRQLIQENVKEKESRGKNKFSRAVSVMGNQPWENSQPRPRHTSLRLMVSKCSSDYEEKLIDQRRKSIVFPTW